MSLEGRYCKVRSDQMLSCVIEDTSGKNYECLFQDSELDDYGLRTWTDSVCYKLDL